MKPALHTKIVEFDLEFRKSGIPASCIIIPATCVLMERPIIPEVGIEWTGDDGTVEGPLEPRG